MACNLSQRADAKTGVARSFRNTQTITFCDHAAASSTAKLVAKRDKGHAAGESLEVAAPVVAVPTIDAVGCSADGKRIFIKGVNTDPQSPSTPESR
jgi:hypothetical protein